MAETKLVFKHDDIVFTWDGGRYVNEWFEDAWEAMEWYDKQDGLPRSIENVIENNIGPFRAWDIYNGLPVAPIATEQAAFEAYVTEYIAAGQGKQVY